MSERILTTDPAQDLFPTASPAGRVAFASDRGGAFGVWIHDLRSGAETPLDVGPLLATYPAYSPDGAWLAFEGSAAGTTASSIYVVRAAGGAPVQLTDDPSSNGGPAWSPDGATLAWTRSGPAGTEIVVRPVAGGGVTVVSSQGDSEPAFQPGAAGRLVLRSFRYGDPELVLIDTAGAAAPARVTSDGAGCGGPALLPRR